ncbi:unnamed protein product [Schistocephalus solidus]|uniref:Uncharacterized protein n=1 Tax=Schistocephalus solidus TaxID=70667 RepID=A0A183SKG8_SCHSO|nr:unnamed protein product [Schistocephalus solidus]
MGENGTKLLQQIVTEKDRELKAARDAALENKFHKLPNPTLSKNGILVHNLSPNELTKEQVQVLWHEASFNVITAVELAIYQMEAMEELSNLISSQMPSLLLAHKHHEILSKDERDALRELKADRDNVIVSADKGFQCRIEHNRLPAES